ncbi:MAG: FG-GAP repeat domain-containing protein [Thermodesulfovibrionales bacterium]
MVCLIFALLLFLLTSGNKVSAQQWLQEQNPPQKLIEDLTGFFKDIKAEVLSIDGDYLRIGAGLKDGMKQYMRFDIVTAKKIKHPVTEEEIWTGDIKTGRVEIVRVEEDFSEGRMLEGVAEPGSRIILSNSTFKVYVQEEKGIDYFIVDDFIRELKKTGRFEIVNNKSLSDIVIILSLKDETHELSKDVPVADSSYGGNKTVVPKLLQKALWTQTGNPFFESEAELQRDYIEKLEKDRALYEEELKSSDLLLSFRLPGSVRFINIADIDGDGKEELILARDDSIEIYSLGVTLKGLHEIKLKGEVLGLYNADLNGDGKAEIIVSALQDNRATSHIYELRDGEFSSIYKETGFIRYINGKLFTQPYSPYDGPSGEIKELKPSFMSPVGEKSQLLLVSASTPDLSLKQGYDIFSFVFVNDCMTLTYDDRGYIYLHDKDGKLLWRSEKDTGGFFSTFPKASRSPLLKEEEWTLKDRLIIEDEKIYLIRRTPVSGIAKGIGWSSSSIVSLRWDGKDMIEEKIKEVGGAIVDFYLTKDRLYVLQKPFMGISLSSLLKGENPKQTRLYIFKRN